MFNICCMYIYMYSMCILYIYCIYIYIEPYSHIGEAITVIQGRKKGGSDHETAINRTHMPEKTSDWRVIHLLSWQLSCA